MAKTASQIVDRALTLIDEVPTTFNTAATTETSLREIALEILPEVSRDLVKELPWDLKKHVTTRTSSLAPDTLTSGEDQSEYVKKKIAFELPTQYWEFISIKLEAWAKPVTKYIYIDSDEYSKQNNPFTRGGKQNPVVAISDSVDSGLKKRLECFSINDGDSEDIEWFEYFDFNNYPGYQNNTWPDELFDEITKALATELNIIKSRAEEAVIRGQQTNEAIEQHE